MSANARSLSDGARGVESIHEYNGAEYPPLSQHSDPTIAIDVKTGLASSPNYFSSKKIIQVTTTARPVTDYRVIRAIGISADSHLSPIKADHPRLDLSPILPLLVLLRYTRPSARLGRTFFSQSLGTNCRSVLNSLSPKETRESTAAPVFSSRSSNSIAGLVHPGLAPRASFGGAILFPWATRRL